jgi:hypothetical protein
MTSSTVVLRTALSATSEMIGVYPVIKKWHLSGRNSEHLRITALTGTSTQSTHEKAMHNAREFTTHVHLGNLLDGLLPAEKNTYAVYIKLLPGSGDERGDQANEVVVHVARVPQRGGGGRHHRGHQRVQLVHRGVLQFQPAGEWTRAAVSKQSVMDEYNASREHLSRTTDCCCLPRLKKTQRAMVK